MFRYLEVIGIDMVFSDWLKYFAEKDNVSVAGEQGEGLLVEGPFSGLDSGVQGSRNLDNRLGDIKCRRIIGRSDNITLLKYEYQLGEVGEVDKGYQLIIESLNAK